MNRTWYRGFRGLAATAALLTIGASAQAGIFGGGFNITAESSLGIASAQIAIENFEYNAKDETWTWALEGPIELRSAEGALVATLSEATSFYQADPVVTLGFFVIAGAADTHFQVSSALLSFAGIPSANGQASAGMTLTDSDQNGATLTGHLGGKAYRAHYNGFLGASSTFTSLVNGFGVGAGGSGVNAESFGFAPVGTTVNDMSSQFDFTVTANDLAGGTSRYEIVPEPASMGALALGLGTLVLRRRRK